MIPSPMTQSSWSTANDLTEAHRESAPVIPKKSLEVEEPTGIDLTRRRGAFETVGLLDVTSSCEVDTGGRELRAHDDKLTLGSTQSRLSSIGVFMAGFNLVFEDKLSVECNPTVAVFLSEHSIAF